MLLNTKIQKPDPAGKNLLLACEVGEALQGCWECRENKMELFL